MHACYIVLTFTELLIIVGPKVPFITINHWGCWWQRFNMWGLVLGVEMIFITDSIYSGSSLNWCSCKQLYDLTTLNLNRHPPPS